MADEPVPASFEGNVDTTFAVIGATGDEVCELTLANVVAHSPSPGAPRAQPFSLIFLGPAGQHLPQATYTLQHADLGELDIFLVPVGPAADGRHQYEAAFN